MKTLLEAIQQYPEHFISTCKARADLETPCENNRTTHTCMAILIEEKAWEGVDILLQRDYYQKPLEGVIFCLPRYSNIDQSSWGQIVNLFEEGKLV